MVTLYVPNCTLLRMRNVKVCMYLIDAGPVPVSLLQEPGEGLLLPLPHDGARHGGGHVAAAVHHGDQDEGLLAELRY